MPSTSHLGTKRKAGNKQKGKTENSCRDKGCYKATRRGYEFYLRVLYLSHDILYKILYRRSLIRKGFSTEQAILEITDSLNMAIDNKRIPYEIF